MADKNEKNQETEKNGKTQNSEAGQSSSQNQRPEENENEQFLLGEAAGFSPSSRMPPFWKTDPELWFETAETIFAAGKVTQSEMKFQITVANLNYDIINEVADVIRSPPSERPYETLKDRLISIFAESENQRIHRILGGRRLGDSEKPSLFLRELRRLAGANCCPQLLRSIWLGALPDRMQGALSVITENDLTKLAEIADRIAEIYEPPAFPAPRPHHSRHMITRSSRESLKRKSRLEEAIEKLSIEINELKAQLSKGSSQNHPQEEPRPRTRPVFLNLCFYHQTYRHLARNCRPPCDWNKHLNQRN